MTKHEAHKYKKIRFRESGFVVYKCILSGCSHYVPPELLIGRKSVCWRCGGEHTINDIKLAKQVCEDCRDLRRKTKKKKFNDSTIDTLLNLIGG